MGKWADLVLTGDFENKSAADSMQRMYEEDMRRKTWPPPSQFNEPLRTYRNKDETPKPKAPQVAAPSAPAAAAPVPAPSPGKWSSQVLGGSAPQPVASAPEPKQEGWGEWAYNTVMGRKDPREANTGTVFDQFRGELGNPTANAAIFGASDPAMGDVIAKTLGDKVIRREKDANGYEVMVTRGPDGQEQRGYVNKPGLDMQDVSRGIYGALPYALTGSATGAALRGAGLGVNALAQGAAAAGTSIAGDVGAMTQGSEQGIDLPKAAMVGGFGAAGPVVGAAAGSLWRRFVTIPGLIDDQTGQLTAKGIAAAREAGVDPADVAPDFARSFAKTFAETKDPALAATRAGTERYGIPATQGQVTKDPYLLTQEEGMRRRLYGEGAQDTMLAFDKRQSDAVKRAALGDISGQSPGPSIGAQINPNRGLGFAPEANDIGGAIQQGVRGARDAAKSLETKAWEGAKGLEVTDDALQFLPDYLNQSLAGRQINEQIMPASSAMAKEVERMISGEAPAKAAGWVANNPSRNVDQMRRTLLSYYKAAGNSEDQSAAKSIYDGFNEWIGEAARANLLKGDPAAALQLVKARGFTREVHAIFEPKDAAGQLSQAGARIGKILDPAKTDSGEAVVQALFGSHGSMTPQSGAVGALQNIKTALERFQDPAAASSAWNDIRFAYWSRLVTNKGGDVLGPQAIVTNIKTALRSKDAVMQALYTPKELTEIRMFLRAMNTIAYKPPNASGSGYTAASFVKDGLLKLLDSFGLGRVSNAALNYTGIGSAWNAAGARAAVRQSTKPARPNLTPLITGAGQAYENQYSR